MKEMDREKVIKGLDVCLNNIDQSDCPNDCPYLSDCSKYENRVVFQPLMRDALALLKEQEPKLVRIDEDSVHCPSCGNELFTFPQQKFCDECGQAVKWA